MHRGMLDSFRAFSVSDAADDATDISEHRHPEKMVEAFPVGEIVEAVIPEMGTCKRPLCKSWPPWRQCCHDGAARVLCLFCCSFRHSTASQSVCVCAVRCCTCTVCVSCAVLHLCVHCVYFERGVARSPRSHGTARAFLSLKPHLEASKTVLGPQKTMCERPAC
jgi:hypothetical protein